MARLIYFELCRATQEETAISLFLWMPNGKKWIHKRIVNHLDFCHH